MHNIYKAILTLLVIGILMIPALPTLAVSPDTNLSDADASFLGEATNDESGRSVSEAGDVNGDGYNDFLIGAFGNDDGGENAGQTYLFFGKASGWDMDTDLSDANGSFWGENAGDYSGYSVSCAGDVNGDGFDDFLIGAWENDEGGVASGQTYLILGGTSGWAMDTDLSTADASFWGEDALDCSGRAVSGAGDVNGDGYDDFLIGAQDNGAGGLSAGQTYLILGRELADWGMDYDLSVADASFWGEDAGDYSGRAISGAGDVNGDGYDDFLIGAWENDEGGATSGQTYLILGRELADWGMDYDLSVADASFWGENVDDWSGFFVSGAGDVNSDSFDDFLIGTNGPGETYIIFGKDSGWTMDTSLSTADASFWEGSSGGQLSSAAGDVNNDGYDDFLMAQTGKKTYLMFGKASGWAMDTAFSTADASFMDENPGDLSGWSVSGVGDVNGDGFDDILIGAPGNMESGFSAGQTYLILGSVKASVVSTRIITVYQAQVTSGVPPIIRLSSAGISLDFSACTGNGFVTLEEIDATPLRGISAGRYWSLDSTGISNFTYDVTFEYTDEEIAEADCGEADLRIFINDGTGWKKHPFTPDVATNRITATGLTSMCDIALGDGNSSIISPVSEILTIVFVAIGMMALGAFFWYRKKRRSVLVAM